MDTPTLALTHNTAARNPNNVVGQKTKSRRKRTYKPRIRGLAAREQSKSDTACPIAVAKLLTALQECGNYAETLPVPRMNCIEAVVAMPQLCGQKASEAGTEAAAPKAPTRSRCVRKHMRKRANKRARKEAAHVLVGLAANTENVAVQGGHKVLGPALASTAESHTEPVIRQAPAPTTSSIPVSIRGRSASGTIRPRHMHVPRHPLVPYTVLINNWCPQQAFVTNTMIGAVANQVIFICPESTNPGSPGNDHTHVHWRRACPKLAFGAREELIAHRMQDHGEGPEEAIRMSRLGVSSR